MKNVVQISALGVLAVALLSSCGNLLGGVIGPQPLGDVLGLNDVTLQPATLAPQAVSGSTSFGPNTFNDVSVPDAMKQFGVTPKGGSATVSVTGVQITNCENAPNSFTVNVSNFNVTLMDSASRTASVNFPTLSVTIARNGNNFSVSGNATFNATLANVPTLFNIATTPQAQNTVSGSATITSSLDALNGCRITLKLGNSGTTVTF